MKKNEIILNIMEERNITAYRLSLDCNIHQSTIASWKEGKSSPTNEQLIILSNYFGYSIDYLLTGKIGEKLTDNEKELIKNFRLLPRNLQMRVLGSCETLLELENEKKKKKGVN